MTERNLAAYEEKYEKVHITGKGGVVKRPVLDSRGLQEIGPNQEPVLRSPSSRPPGATY